MKAPSAERGSLNLGHLILGSARCPGVCELGACPECRSVFPTNRW